MGYVESDLQEIVNLTEEYMQNVAALYEKEPKKYISKVGMSHSKLITKLRKTRKQWENTMQKHKYT